MLTESPYDHRLRPSRLRLLAYSVVALAAALSTVLWSQGHPAILVPAAAVIGVALPASRRLPVPAAFAAALMLVVGFYLAAVLGLGLTSVSVPMSPAVALAVLLAPCLGVMADLALMTGSPASRRASFAGNLTERTVFAAAWAGPALLLIVLGIATVRYGEGALAFALGGDARNHVLIARDVLSIGGLDGRILSQNPALSNSVLALLMDSLGRGGASPAQVLRNDIEALAAMIIWATIAWSLSSASLVWAVGGLRGRAQAFPMAAASLIPLMGLGLGVALRDGFFSIVFAMPLFISALSLAAWTVRTRDRRRGSMLRWAALAVSLPVAATSWSPMLPIVTMVVAGALVGFHRHSMVRETLKAAGIVGLAMVAALLTLMQLLLPLVGSPRMAQLTATTGSIVPPSPAVFAVVPLVVVAIAAAGLPRVRRFAFLPYLFGTLAASAVVAYAVAQQPPGLLWNYYPSKLAWIWVLVGFPLLLTPAAFGLSRHSATVRRSRALEAAFAAAASVAVLGLAVMSARVSSPLLPPAAAPVSPGAHTPGGTWSILNGWGQPDSRMVDAVLTLGAQKPSLVFWEYTDQGNDRLGNFWLDTYEPPQLPGSETPNSDFEGWAYSYDPSNTSQLCDLLDRDPQRIVATRNSLLPSVVSRQCGLPADRVWVVP